MIIATAGNRLAAVAIASGPARSTPAPAASMLPATQRIEPPATSSTFIVQRAVLQPTIDEEWARQLRDPAYWAQRRIGGGGSSSAWNPGATGGSRANQLGAGAPGLLDPFWGPGFGFGGRGWNLSSGTYRTMCVRQCDGYYWPVNFATTKSNFQRDAAKCEASCAGAKLYVYRNPGGEVDDMEDLRGQPYRKLATAFLYRTQYDAACKCQPHPWEEAARLRHRIYALDAASRRGDQKASAELKQIRDTVRQSRIERRAEAGKGSVETARLVAATFVVDPATAQALRMGPIVGPGEKEKASSSKSAKRTTTKSKPKVAAANGANSSGGQAVMRLGAQQPRLIKAGTATAPQRLIWPGDR